MCFQRLAPTPYNALKIPRALRPCGFDSHLRHHIFHGFERVWDLAASSEMPKLCPNCGCGELTLADVRGLYGYWKRMLSDGRESPSGIWLWRISALLAQQRGQAHKSEFSLKNWIDLKEAGQRFTARTGALPLASPSGVRFLLI